LPLARFSIATGKAPFLLAITLKGKEGSLPPPPLPLLPAPAQLLAAWQATDHKHRIP
jgi:hypothetical protein